MNQKSFQCFGRGNSKSPQCTFTCHLRSNFFKEQLKSFFLMCDPGSFILNRQKPIRDIIRAVYSPRKNCPGTECVYFHTWKENFEFCFDCLENQMCFHVLKFPVNDQKPTFMLFRGDVPYCFDKQTNWDYGKNQLLFWGSSPPITIRHSRTCAKNGNNRSIHGIIVSTSHWLTQATQNFSGLKLQLSVYSKEAIFSQPRVMVLCGLSNLVAIH